MMDRDRFQRLERAFARARDLPKAQRQALLLGLGPDAAELREQLMQMLADHDAHGGDSLLEAGDAMRQELVGAAGASADAAARAEVALPVQVARFRIVGEIARGGIGRVLRAEDPVIGREVAVKMLRPEFAHRPDAIAMLAREGRLGGRLQHPSIVPVYEIGTTDAGQPFLAMKVIDGRDLASLLAERDNPADNRARFVSIFEQICQAIAYAHRCGVVHRDLKPHNVMVGAFGEVQVMDWGIALELGRPSAGPADGDDGSAPVRAVSGTPAYMAPEQARGDVAHTDRRTDVFGLGAILCEILTGSPPYGSGPMTQVLERARRADLAAASARIREGADDPELARLALHCLAVDPTARPLDAAAVAATLRHHIDTAAARLRRAELEAKTAIARADGERKVRRLIVALAATIVAVTIGGAWLWTATQRAARDRTALAEKRITAAIVEAERLSAVAEATPHADPAAWDAAVQAAGNACALVVADVSMDLAQRAEELRQQAGRSAGDLRFVQALMAASSEASCASRFDRRPMARAMRRLVAERLGASIEEVAPATAAAALRSIRWRELLVQTFDAWIRLELESDAGSAIGKRVRAVADLLDDDTWRREVRAASADRNRHRLNELANDPAAQTAPAATLRHLALALMAANDFGPGLDVMRNSVAQHPDDFASLLDLSWFVLAANTLTGIYEAQRYVQATLAAQPDNPAALELHSVVQSLRGEHQAALAAIDKAIDVAPTEIAYRRTRGRLRRVAGDLDGAVVDYEAVLAGIEPSHAVWSMVQFEFATALTQLARYDEAWQHYHDGVRSEHARDDAILGAGAELMSPHLAAIAREHTADAESSWSAYLLLGMIQDQQDPTAALQAFERIVDAPSWCMRFAARRIVELRERLGSEPVSFGTAERAIRALPRDLDFEQSRRRLQDTVMSLREAGKHAIAEYLQGLLCERAERTDAALDHYRAAIAADRDAIEAWVRLHGCRGARDGVEAADTELRTLVAEQAPAPILRLPLRAPRLTTMAGAGTADLALAWTRQEQIDARAPALATELRIHATSDENELHAAVDLTFVTAVTRFDLPPGLLAAGVEYRAAVRHSRAGDAAPGPWSPPVSLRLAAGSTPVPIDLGEHFTADVVADPGDGEDDAFDGKNGYRLTIDGFDGERDDVATAQGLPRDGHLGLFVLGRYDRPQSIAFNRRSRPVRITLPPDHYSALHVLAGAANGNVLLPFAIGYDDSDQGGAPSYLFLADWFFSGSPPGLDREHIGIPAVRGMDRIGRAGFEERNAAVLHDKMIPVDPTRIARWLVLLPDKAGWADDDAEAHVLAVTAMRAGPPRAPR